MPEGRLVVKKFGFSLEGAIAKSKAVEVVTGEPAAPPSTEPAPAAPPEPASAAQRTVERPLDIVPVTIQVTPEDRKRLRQLALDSGRSLQSLGIEAWSLLLESRGLSPLAPTKANVPDGRRKSTEPKRTPEPPAKRPVDPAAVQPHHLNALIACERSGSEGMPLDALPSMMPYLSSLGLVKDAGSWVLTPAGRKVIEVARQVGFPPSPTPPTP